MDLEVAPTARHGRGRQSPQRAAAGRPETARRRAVDSSTTARSGGSKAWPGRSTAAGWRTAFADHARRRRRSSWAEIESGRDDPGHARRRCATTRPAFDPEGKYLYFIGQRDFDPVYDELQFDLGFPKGTRPFAITLRKDLAQPVHPAPQAARERGGRRPRRRPRPSGAARRRRSRSTWTASSGARWRSRCRGAIRPGPGHQGEGAVLAVPDRGQPAAPSWYDTSAPAKGVLDVYDFENQKQERLIDGITDFWVGRDGKTLLYRAGERLRVLKAGEKPPTTQATSPAATSGWIDLDAGARSRSGRAPSGARCSARPGGCSASTSGSRTWPGMDWDAIYQRYLPLVDRVTTRSELSDLLWEIQGELGTSHAYEIGGEYRPGPTYRQGYLGVDWELDPRPAATASPASSRATRGTRARPRRSTGPGVDVQVGRHRAGDQRPAGRRRTVTPGERLVNQADQEVLLTDPARATSEPRTVTVKALGDERPARYRDWVEAQPRAVHEATDGRVGYIHIPDMGPEGYAEFHRGYLVEYDREGLIVDVRFNGGGHVSQLLLEKLARRRLGYDFPRWGAPEPYPDESPRGPMVALTNELAGSDGDIFSHTFKLLELGPLVGKRTWGGVIGIWPRHTLADGTLTTQPEFSFFFDDVGWNVENYGTDPDIEVDNAPQDYAAGRRPAARQGDRGRARSAGQTPTASPPPDRSTAARGAQARPARRVVDRQGSVAAGLRWRPRANRWSARPGAALERDADRPSNAAIRALSS